MIVERYTWEAKPGRRQDAIEWCQERRRRAQQVDESLTIRIYAPLFGAWNRVMMEVEYESEEHRKAYWAGIEWTEDLQEFAATHHEMIGLGQTYELFELR